MNEWMDGWVSAGARTEAASPCLSVCRVRVRPCEEHVDDEDEHAHKHDARRIFWRRPPTCACFLAARSHLSGVALQTGS